eukprot:scaffold3800_cov137-Pinguiococcus_pyrenoidosus.AAC.2
MQTVRCLQFGAAVLGYRLEGAVARGRAVDFRVATVRHARLHVERIRFVVLREGGIPRGRADRLAPLHKVRLPDFFFRPFVVDFAANGRRRRAALRHINVKSSFIKGAPIRFAIQLDRGVRRSLSRHLPSLAWCEGDVFRFCFAEPSPDLHLFASEVPEIRVDFFGVHERHDMISLGKVVALHGLLGLGAKVVVALRGLLLAAKEVALRVGLLALLIDAAHSARVGHGVVEDLPADARGL